MMDRRIQGVVIAGLAVFLFAGKASGDSLFAVGAFGMPTLQVDGRGMGMGGTSLALIGESFSPSNPAVSTMFRRSGLSGMVIPGYSFPRDRQASSTNRYYEFSFIRLVFPIPAKFVFSAGFHQFLDFDWEISHPFSFQGEALTEVFRSTGSIFKGQIAIARPIFAGFRGGFGLDFYRGKITDLREMIFQGTFYPVGSAIDVKDEYSYETKAVGMTVGLLYLLRGKLGIGFFVSPGFDLDLDETFRTNPGSVSKRSFFAEMPYSWGIGVSTRLKDRVLLAFDHVRSNWSTFSFEEGDSPRMRDEQILALGVEFTPAGRHDGSWLKRSAMRTGFRWRALPMKVEGVGVDERVITLGWGVPMGAGSGRFDLSVEIGSRGSLEENGMRERLVRFGLALSAFEKWVPLDRRRRR